MEKKMFYYVEKNTKKPILLASELDAQLCRVGESKADYFDGCWVKLNDTQIAFYEANPTASIIEILDMQLLPKPEPPEPPKPSYEDLVSAKIRERYPQDLVEAIIRKKLAGLDNGAFDEFNAYCEDCKLSAKQELEVING